MSGEDERGNPLAAINAALEAEACRAHGVVGWRMHDTPKLSQEYMDKFVALCGEENIRFVCGSTGSVRFDGEKFIPCEPWVRSSYLLSPEAVRRCQEYASALASNP